MYMYTHSHAARLCYISFPLQGPATLSQFPHSRLCSGGGGDGGGGGGGGNASVLILSDIIILPKSLLSHISFFFGHFNLCVKQTNTVFSSLVRSGHVPRLSA